eukprot:NODE_1447_length_1139_cov_317.477860.p1 GENE.NODE_1447_length_1139_cov_317.477860~~NODE_1447_length_1139_cov_317.477860.p1  ORF type:complete len:311 (-),score=97.51 NODE_1447_length_1139_cov_317.477860:189-1046(-)
MVERSNAAGQTFLHIAADRGNCGVLTHVLKVRPMLSLLFARQDDNGFTPMDLLAQHVRECGPLARPPRAEHLEFGEQLATNWVDAGGYQVPRAGSATPWSDLDIVVLDERSGSTVCFAAHRDVLSAASPAWRERLRFVGNERPVLKIDPQCCRSAAVVNEALQFLYTGRFAGELECNGRLLVQLLSLCVSCELVEALRRCCTAALLSCLDRPENATVLPVLLRGAGAVGLSALERRFVACLFLNAPGALVGMSSDPKVCEKASITLRLALEEVEHCLEAHASRHS